MSKFKQGKSGNPNGRPKGAKNRLGLPLRERLTGFLTDNLDLIIEDFPKLKRMERAKVYRDLLQYGLPKHQALSIESKFEHLSDEDLTKMINKILGNTEN